MLVGMLPMIVASETLGACPPGVSAADLSVPTDPSRTFIRKGAGEYGAPRDLGPHTGVDIVVRATYPDASAYAVKAIADGNVAYAQFNGGELDKGFGNVVIIDHGNGCYSMAAHLASAPFTPLPDDPSAALLVKVGDHVTKGAIIGYFVDHTKGVHSTGNAMRTAAGARWQTHFELIEAPSGRAGSGTLKEVIFHDDGHRINPTSILVELGLKIEPAAP